MNGVEWLIEAFECSDKAIREMASLEELFQRIVSEMSLHPLGSPHWHRFPDGGGITGVWMLQESHLTVHTFPEYRSACVNVFCCRPRQPLDWRVTFSEVLGSTNVRVREHQRVYRLDD
jgi:S-adenosylmethionine decarboxylase